MREEIMRLIKEIFYKDKLNALYGEEFFTINVNANGKEYIVEYKGIFDFDKVGVYIYDINGNFKDIYYIDLFRESEDE